MKALCALHCISIGFSRKGIQTRMPFLRSYKSNKPHHKKYFNFFHKIFATINIYSTFVRSKRHNNAKNQQDERFRQSI